MGQLGLKDRIQRIEALKKEYRYKSSVGLKKNQTAFDSYLMGWMGLQATQMDFSIDRIHFKDEAAFKLYVNKARMGSVDAYECMNERVQSGEKSLSVDFIQDLHTLLLGVLYPEEGGKWRDAPARWLNSTMIVSNYRKIKQLIDDTVNGFNERVVPAFFWDEYPNSEYQSFAFHSVMRAIQINYNIVAIHPFSDGNKRIARLLTNFVLMSNGFAPMNICNREQYISGIENYFSSRQPHQFYHTMFTEIERSHYDIIHEIEHFPQNPKDPKLIVEHGNQFRKRLDQNLFHGKTR